MPLQSRRISLPRAFIAVLGVLGSGVPACWWPGPYIELTESAGPVDPVTSGDSGGDLTGTTSSEETSGADAGGDTGGDTDSPPLDCPLAPGLIDSGMSGVPKALYQDSTCDIFLLSHIENEGVKIRRIDEVGEGDAEDFVPHQKGVQAAAINSIYLSAVMGGTNDVHTLITWDPATLEDPVSLQLDYERTIDVIATRPSGPQRWLGMHKDATISGVLVGEGNSPTELSLETVPDLQLNAVYPSDSGTLLWVVGRSRTEYTTPVLVALDLKDSKNNAEIALPEEAKSTANDALSAVLVDQGTVYAAGYRDMQLILLKFEDVTDPEVEVYEVGSKLDESTVIILEGLIRVGDSLILVGHGRKPMVSTAILYRIPLGAVDDASPIITDVECRLRAIAPVPGSTSSFLVAGEAESAVTLKGLPVEENGGFIARLSLDP